MPVKQVTIPKYLKSEPTEADWEIIREHSYDYAETIVQAGKDLDKPIEFVPGLMELLKPHDLKYERVKPIHIKSTNRFIDLLRQEISNKINKVLREKKTPRQKPSKEQQDSPGQDDQDEDDDVVEEMEEEEEDEQEEQPSGGSANASDPGEDHIKDSKPKAKTPIKTQSKKITKKSGEIVYIDVAKGKEDAWRKVAYLKEIINGRQFELKGLQRKYQRKFADFAAMESPTTPPPEDFTEANQPEYN